jgi:heme/copper-type cytochrome/quinol oxidase subunit 3
MTAVEAPGLSGTTRLDELPSEAARGTWAVWLVIVTEALLFVSLLFAYFYVGHGQAVWPPHPPERRMALELLAILLASSVVAEIAKEANARGHERVARFALVVTILLGLGFLGLQAHEFRERLLEIQPWSDVYGSLFFGITSFHALHVLVGVLMLVWVACLSRLRSARSPHRALENVTLYWHFVDVVCLVLVAVLYLLPGWTS